MDRSKPAPFNDLSADAKLMAIAAYVNVALLHSELDELDQLGLAPGTKAGLVAAILDDYLPRLMSQRAKLGAFSTALVESEARVEGRGGTAN